jgi:hypothetical protein
MGREPKLMVTVGRKNCGKSFTTTKMMEQYVAGNPSKGIPPRRVLILDVNDEYVQYKAIRISDVPIFSVHPIIEIRRVRPFNDNGTKMSLDQIQEALYVILETYKNGFLLIEDLNKFISENFKTDLAGSIATNRHVGLDIMIHYQSIGRINTKVWQNVNLIRLHKFTDTVKRHKNKFEDKYEYLSIAETIINNRYDKGDKRFFVYVDIDDEKIFGAFTNKEFDDAAMQFITINYSSLINPLLNARDENGRKIHTAQSAIAEVKKRMSFYKK